MLLCLISNAIGGVLVLPSTILNQEIINLRLDEVLLVVIKWAFIRLLLLLFSELKGGV